MAGIIRIPPPQLKPLKLLVGCETSGVVRRAFAELGHDVWSCDLLPADDGSNRHIVCDVRDLLNDEWDMVAVMHPPCTRLCNSGVRWLKTPPPGRTLEEMWAELDEGAELFSACWNAPIARIAIENPVMHRYAKERIRDYRKPAQTVQPWWFGEPAFKATSFYLRGLLPLRETNRLVPPKPGTDEHKFWSQVHRAPPGRDRWKIRSKTYEGIAAAMALQWGGNALRAAA
ncbi:Putative phage protein Gp12 [Neorhizobium galegae bv. officinalis]|nr:Putative phage protein Gp12 [Neorhizobium galegae bv. officinalis]